MPTITTLSNARIVMFAGDHAPPHFHLTGPNSQALVLLDTLIVARGHADRRDLAEAITWARANMAALVAQWSRLNER